MMFIYSRKNDVHLVSYPDQYKIFILQKFKTNNK